MTIRILRQGIAMFMVLVVIMAMSWTMPHDTEARNVRNNTRTNVNRNLNSNRNVNVNCNRNVNCNINVNRDVDIDVDHHYGGYHPVATAVGVAAAATITAAVVGSIVYSLPPACSMAVVGGITYQNCGGTWYQPQYMGTQVSYVVVNPPRY
jgi:hypothetical protein